MTVERDDREAIDKSNIVKGRTRGATKEPGTYVEPGDEEVSAVVLYANVVRDVDSIKGLPGPDDGTSAVR